MRTRPRGMAPVPSQWLTTLKFMLNPLRVVLGLLRGAHLIQGTHQHQRRALRSVLASDNYASADVVNTLLLSETHSTLSWTLQQHLHIPMLCCWSRRDETVAAGAGGSEDQQPVS
jgi:hypothetical protein